MTYARAALAGLILVAVTACSGGDPADGDAADGDPTTPPTSASPSPTPTLAPPTIPPEAKEHSAAGAAAFVKYYVSLFNYASVTGDVSELDARSDPACVACTRLIKRFGSLADVGGYSENPHWRATVTSSQLLKGDFHVTVDVTSSDYLYKPDADTAEGLVKGGTYHDLYRLKWSGGDWTVHLLAEQDVPKT